MSDLKRVASMAEMVSAAIDQVDELTQQLKDAKEKVTKLTMEDLPELLREVGVSSISLEDGTAVDLRDEVDAKITEKKKPLALKWLREHDFGGIIKTEFVTSFGADEEEEQQTFAESVPEEWADRTQAKETVHAATLKAFVKEQMEQGNEVPADIFGVHCYSVAKVTKPKGK